MVPSYSNPDFTFDQHSAFCLTEDARHRTREPWLMLLARRGREPRNTLCWGLTNAGSSFARIGTQEGDLVNGFVHEDPYKTRILGPYTYLVPQGQPYFTNTWYPVCREQQTLETRYHLGWFEQETRYAGLSVRTLSFIPDQFDALVQILTVTNETERPQTLGLYTINPINIGDARNIQFSGFNTLMMGGGIIDPELDAIVWRNSYGIPFEDDPGEVRGVFGKLAVHGSSLEGCSFSTRYEDFIGHYSNTMANPQALEQQTLAGRDAQELTSSLSAIRGDLRLKPGESRDVVLFTLATSTQDYYRNSKITLKKNLQTLRNPEAVRALLRETQSGWQDDIDRLGITVPGEEEFNHSFRWLQYQCSMVAIMNRMKSRFHSGFEYGYGFRDILQDMLAILPRAPRDVAGLLSYTAQQMFSDGSVYHNFFVSAPGNKDFQACDDPLWFVFAVCEYLKETGDLEFITHIIDYADEKEGLPRASGTILDHCRAALDRVWSNSDRGLPRMMDADWNDDLSAYSNHLSTMAALMLYKALTDFADLLDFMDAQTPVSSTTQASAHSHSVSPREAGEYRRRARQVRQQIETRGIDPQGYYIRAVAPDPSTPHLGSSLSDGFVFFEPIAWAGYSGLADRDRFDILKKTVEDNLDDEFGIALCQGDTTLTQGRLPEDYAAWKRNAPGKKENGGEFRHLESWYMASLCIFGYGAEAWDLCKKTLPITGARKDPWRYAAEPFVYPEYVSGPASNEHGRAGHTWLTGTAPTRLNMIVQYILGIRADYRGLVIDPCVSPEWRKFSARRRFRNTDFTLEYRNPGGAQGGVARLCLDGHDLPGNLIPLDACDGGRHRVVVYMGGDHE